MFIDPKAAFELAAASSAYLPPIWYLWKICEKRLAFPERIGHLHKEQHELIGVDQFAKIYGAGNKWVIARL